MQFDKWLHLLYINTDIPFRNPPSKHQAKIREIFDQIQYAQETGVMDPLLQVTPISCIGESEVVSYCRYLQHMIRVLKDEGKQE